MTQIYFTDAERLGRLERFGYTAPEARFLCLAALHCGYFLRRQAAEFLAANGGGLVAPFIERVFANCHAAATAYDRNTHLYHLCTRPFYAAIGQEDNRNRRIRETSTIKKKLMGLDFVLAHPGVRFLATEIDQVAYFTRTRGIRESILPGRVYRGENGPATHRFFVEKYPIFIRHETDLGAVSFCFVDEGTTTSAGFKTFLDTYRRLFVALGMFHVIYVAAHHRPFATAEAVFENYLAKPSAVSSGRENGGDVLERLANYFALRRQYEAKDFDGLDRAKLTQLRTDQGVFSGPQNDQLYEVWKTGGHIALRQSFAPESIDSPTFRPTFSTHLLEHDYDFFGTLTSR